mgnify:CR=1 FL=1
MQVCYSIATVVTLVSVMLQAKTFFQQLRRRKADFWLEEAELVTNSRLRKHQNNLFETNMQLRLIGMSMAVGIAEVRRNHDCSSKNHHELAIWFCTVPQS